MNSYVIRIESRPSQQMINARLVKGTYRVPTAHMTESEIQRHIDKMTFVPKSQTMGMEHENEPVTAAIVEGNELVVPRAYGFSTFGPPAVGWATDDFDTTPRPTLEFNGTLRAEQQQPEASDKVVNQLMRKGGAVLILPCGYGKTTVALNIASRMRGRVLILVHKSVLLTQWEERIAQFLPSAKVGILRSDRIEADESRDIVIGMLQSVYQRGSEYQHVLVGFNLLVVDEAHRVPAATFFSAVKSVSARFTLGLTATPDRKDGMTGLLYAALGDVAFQIQREPSSQAYACIKQISCSPDIREKPLYGKQTINFSKLITDLSKDKLRTQSIVDDIATVLCRPRYVIVLADRTALLKDIQTRLMQMDIPCLRDDHHGGARVIIGSTKASERDDALSARVVLSTFSLAAEGLDRARLDTLVLATPKGDIVQSVGRILRKHPDKQPPLVLDYIDSVNSGVLTGLRRKRENILKQHGFTIVNNLGDTIDDTCDPPM